MFQCIRFSQNILVRRPQFIPQRPKFGQIQRFRFSNEKDKQLEKKENNAIEELHAEIESVTLETNKVAEVSNCIDFDRSFQTT